MESIDVVGFTGDLPLYTLVAADHPDSAEIVVLGSQAIPRVYPIFTERLHAERAIEDLGLKDTTVGTIKKLGTFRRMLVQALKDDITHAGIDIDWRTPGILGRYVPIQNFLDGIADDGG